MFSPDFYPTPPDVIEQMVGGIDLSGKYVFDPEAGSGNIIDYVQIFGAKTLCCEINPDLAAIVGQKCRFLKPDFLEVTSEEISHIDYIIMNPPFSADEKHILHAWNIAQEGCEIISLCNWETINNGYSHDRKCLRQIITENGTSQNLGNVFSRAQRKTEVEVGLIHLYKPRVSEETEWEGYFDMNEHEERQENGIMPHNDIREIVNRYVGAVKMFNSVIDTTQKMNDLINPIAGSLDVEFGAYHRRNSNYSNIDRETFKKELQKSAWKTVFHRLKMQKYTTQKLNEELNKFVEQQTRIPFTIPNIYKMVQMVVGTHSERMNKVIVEAFERICGYADSNSTGGEGWKTNSDYKVNRRFIHPYVCEYDTRWPTDTMKIKHADQFDDIVKAFCLLTGQRYEDQIPLRNYFDYPYHLKRSDGSLMGGYQHSYHSYDEAQKAVNAFREENVIVSISKTGREWGQWYEWGFFRVRGYKKGTMHFEFIDEKVWELFNLTVAKIKGWRLPNKTDKKQKGTERTQETGVDLFSM